jgi:hypothetical protein
MKGNIVPAPVADIAERVKVVLSPEFAILHTTPVAVPFCVISEGVNIFAMIASENVTVKFMGNAFVGSAWPTA